MAETAELSSDLVAGEGIFYMKVGTHAGEAIPDIAKRKQAEIDKHGFTYWGYGGSNCHPLSIVQPFAEELQRNGKIRLLMEETYATHFAIDRVANQYSKDGIEWLSIPDGIEVKGSRYALVITDLSWTSMALPLQQTEVVLGPHSGRRGDQYVTGLVDKACLKVVGQSEQTFDSDMRAITLMATIQEPFAVFLREKPQADETTK